MGGGKGARETEGEKVIYILENCWLPPRVHWYLRYQAAKASQNLAKYRNFNFWSSVLEATCGLIYKVETYISHEKTSVFGLCCGRKKRACS